MPENPSAKTWRSGIRQGNPGRSTVFSERLRIDAKPWLTESLARFMRGQTVLANNGCEVAQVPEDAMDVESLLFATRLACTEHADGTPCVVHARSLVENSEVDCVSLQSMGCCGATFIRAAEGNMEDMMRSASMCGINLNSACENITLPSLPQAATSQVPNDNGSYQRKARHTTTLLAALTLCTWIVWSA